MEEKQVNGLNDKDAKSEVLSWDWGKYVAQTVKLQIELLSNYVVKKVKNKEEKRNRYLYLLNKVSVLLCREFRASRYSENGIIPRKRFYNISENPDRKNEYERYRLYLIL